MEDPNSFQQVGLPLVQVRFAGGALAVLRAALGGCVRVGLAPGGSVACGDMLLEQVGPAQKLCRWLSESAAQACLVLDAGRAAAWPAPTCCRSRLGAAPLWPHAAASTLTDADNMLQHAHEHILCPSTAGAGWPLPRLCVRMQQHQPWHMLRSRHSHIPCLRFEALGHLVSMHTCRWHAPVLVPWRCIMCGCKGFVDAGGVRIGAQWHVRAGVRRAERGCTLRARARAGDFACRWALPYSLAGASAFLSMDPWESYVTWFHAGASCDRAGAHAPANQAAAPVIMMQPTQAAPAPPPTAGGSQL